MTHAEKAQAWLDTAPRVEFKVNDLVVKYVFGYDPNSYCEKWCRTTWLQDTTLETYYFCDILACCEQTSTHDDDIEFVDRVEQALKAYPFERYAEREKMKEEVNHA